MQNWSQEPDTPREIAFLLFDRFSNLCLANCAEPLRAANGFARRPAYRWRFLSIDGAPVRASSGLPVHPDGAVGDMAPGAELLVLASYGHLAHDTAETRRVLRRAGLRASRVVGFDAGPWLMAGAGLLQGRRATLHHDLLDAFAETFLDVEAVTARVVEDGDRVTCAGAMAALDFMRGMIRADLGRAIGLDIDALFLSQADTGASLPRGQPLLARMTALVRGNLETPLSVEDMAQRLGVTPRTLARRCKSGLGASPGAVARHLRLSAARQMVEGTELGIAEIAVRCGYDDPTALTRAFKARFGRAPRQMRQEMSREWL